jgi:hypothetical protein
MIHAILPLHVSNATGCPKYLPLTPANSLPLPIFRHTIRKPDFPQAHGVPQTGKAFRQRIQPHWLYAINVALKYKQITEYVNQQITDIME